MRSHLGQAKPLAFICFLILFPYLSVGLLNAQDPFDLPPIRYSESEANDPVAQFKRKLDSGEIHLKRDPKFGVLPSVLDYFHIPSDSQVLVFSKTSLQVHRISPTNPRALYFNDSVYIGYVPGSPTLELAANDPQLGAVFYTLESDTNNPNQTDRPFEPVALVRDRGQCLSCHATTRTENVPGYLVRSIYPDSSGRPRTGSGSFTTDYRSPFESRWGGWYVTGNHGSMRHLGNAFALDREDPQKVDTDAGANRTELPSRVEASRYLQPHSDLVALMVLEHQIRVHNLITKASYETRQAIALDRSMNQALGREPNFRSESTQRRIQSAANQMADAILFRNEASIDAPVQGTSSFSKTFATQGPKDDQGRSLRELDLQTRLFRYPLSYLIYTDEFQQLPNEVMQPIKQRLREAFANESRSEEQKILEATLPGWLAQD